MKPKHPKNKVDPAAAGAKNGEPTVLEFADTIRQHLAGAVNLPVKQPSAKGRRETPNWVQKIGGTFRKTIFKPILKLKPSPKTGWQDYGKITGVLDRQKTFFTVDLQRICKETIRRTGQARSCGSRPAAAYLPANGRLTHQFVQPAWQT